MPANYPPDTPADTDYNTTNPSRTVTPHTNNKKSPIDRRNSLIQRFMGDGMFDDAPQGVHGGIPDTDDDDDDTLLPLRPEVTNVKGQNTQTATKQLKPRLTPEEQRIVNLIDQAQDQMYKAEARSSLYQALHGTTFREQKVETNVVRLNWLNKRRDDISQEIIDKSFQEGYESSKDYRRAKVELQKVEAELHELERDVMMQSYRKPLLERSETGLARTYLESYQRKEEPLKPVWQIDQLELAMIGDLMTPVEEFAR